MVGTYNVETIDIGTFVGYWAGGLLTRRVEKQDKESLEQWALE